jgi:hypothetical protein
MVRLENRTKGAASIRFRNEVWRRGRIHNTFLLLIAGVSAIRPATGNGQLSAG